MDALEKLEVLKTVYPNAAEFDRLLAKVLEAVLADYRGRLRRYEAELAEFECRYAMNSDTFNQRFEAGELGDAMDFFEWAGLCELRQDLLGKIQRLETAV